MTSFIIYLEIDDSGLETCLLQPLRGFTSEVKAISYKSICDYLIDSETINLYKLEEEKIESIVNDCSDFFPEIEKTFINLVLSDILKAEIRQGASKIHKMEIK